MMASGKIPGRCLASVAIRRSYLRSHQTERAMANQGSTRMAALSFGIGPT
jgi:hypothetical protein